MLTYIRFTCLVYLGELSLSQPQIFISKAHRHTSYIVIVLIEYYFVLFVHRLVSLLFECKYTQYTWF